MASSSGNNYLKRHVQLSLEMCQLTQVPKVNIMPPDEDGDNTFSDDQQLQFEGLQELPDSQDTVMQEPDIVISSIISERYVPHNFDCLPATVFSKTNPVNLKPHKQCFKRFYFLHYVQERDVMVCYFCINTLAEIKFPNCSRIEPSFTNINVGFYNWKKAIEKFTEHRNSKQHKIALEIQLFAKKQSTISCQLDTAVMKSQEEWRNFLLKVITSIKFLGGSGLLVRVHNSNTGLFHELLKLRSTDSASPLNLSHLLVQNICRQIFRIINTKFQVFYVMCRWYNRYHRTRTVKYYYHICFS